MNLSPAWAKFFSENNHAAVHWANVGKPNTPDSDILSYAKEQEHVVLTFALDFTDLLAASGESTPSVIILRTRTLRAEKLQLRLLEVLATCRKDLGKGAVVI